jgi:short-subunit dehydrogenase
LSSKRRAWIVGASAGVGRALAETLAARGWDLVLTARETADIEPLARDLALRFGAGCAVLTADLAERSFDAPALGRRAAEGGEPDAVIVAAGASLEGGDDAPGDDEALALVLRVNLESCARLAAQAAAAAEKRGRGTVTLIGSIAAHAPRGRNMGYSAAKAGLEAYARALRHHAARRGVIVQCYVLGYVDTALTFGKPLLLTPVSAASAAEFIADRLDRDVGVLFYPRYWRAAVALLRLAPWAIFKKLDF